MGKKKKMSIVVTIITLILIITISTTALWRWTSANSNVGFTISGLDAFIIYNKGSDVLTGVLDPVSSYSDSSVSTEITLYKNTSKTLYGHIYLDVTAIGTNIANESAVKWVITSNGEVLNEGDFVGSTVDSSIPLKINIPLSTTEQKFQIYIWLDEGMDINDAIEGEVLSTIARAEASEVEYEIEPNSPDLVEGLIPVAFESKMCGSIESVSYESNPECYDVSFELNETDLYGIFTSMCVELWGNSQEHCSKIKEEIIADGVDEDGNTLDEFIDNYKQYGFTLTSEYSYTFLENNKTGYWVKADSTNVGGSWYNYINKQWANAILVSNTKRNFYKTAEVGELINNVDILAYYVWIPRYKYKVWNINKKIGVDSYNAQRTGIDIVFENGTRTTGTIRCNDYSFSSPIEAKPNETCSGTNGEYYTHPAFWWDTNGNNIREVSEEVKGVWVGKYEISSPSDSACYKISNENNCRNTTLAVRTIPNAVSWRNNDLTNFNYVIQNMQVDSNEYGLTTNKTIANSHMLKNMEWGAVAYLTNSNYGRCTNGVCEEVAINDYSSYKTGCGPQSLGSPNSFSLCNTYISELGQLASTTGNIYGIYDMSGGAGEFVMGNVSSESGNYIYNMRKSSSVVFAYDTTTAKYIDTYAYGDSSYTQTEYNRARLGDATGEITVSSAPYTTGWNENEAFFPDSYYSWFIRGLSFEHANPGVFSFGNDDGGNYIYYSARAALLAP